MNTKQTHKGCLGGVQLLGRLPCVCSTSLGQKPLEMFPVCISTINCLINAKRPPSPNKQTIKEALKGQVYSLMNKDNEKDKLCN